jgi:hypothetical protein
MNVVAHLSVKEYVYVIFFYPVIKFVDLFDKNICSFRLNMVTISQERFLPPVFVFMA